VDQKEDGVISCAEGISENPFVERRLILKGLKNATVHFYPENDREVFFTMNDSRTYNHGSLPFDRADSGKRLVVSDVQGQLTISW
jgi:hypothetical protein